MEAYILKERSLAATVNLWRPVKVGSKTWLTPLEVSIDLTDLLLKETAGKQGIRFLKNNFLISSCIFWMLQFFHFNIPGWCFVELTCLKYSTEKVIQSRKSLTLHWLSGAILATKINIQLQVWIKKYYTCQAKPYFPDLLTYQILTKLSSIHCRLLSFPCDILCCPVGLGLYG